MREFPPAAAGRTASRDQAADLRAAIERCGYYPEVVAEAVDAAVAGEPVVAFVVHHEPTFDRDEIRRHVTVLTLTGTRLVIAHVDEHPPDEQLTVPYASTSTEAVALDRVCSVVVNRIVTNPDISTVGPRRGRPARGRGVREAVLTVGWGAVGRVDLEPATCGDPDCEADHGYTGTITTDDFSLRVSATADGTDGVDGLLGFAQALSSATTSER